MELLDIGEVRVPRRHHADDRPDDDRGAVAGVVPGRKVLVPQGHALVAVNKARHQRKTPFELMFSELCVNFSIDNPLVSTLVFASTIRDHKSAGYQLF